MQLRLGRQHVRALPNQLSRNRHRKVFRQVQASQLEVLVRETVETLVYGD